MSAHQGSEKVLEESRKECADEFRKMQRTAHRLLDHLTAISGYTQIVHTQVDPRRDLAELGNILTAVEKSSGMLRLCILNLKEFERRLS